MQAILGGQEITWVIPLESEGGVQLNAVSVEYSISNQADVVLQAKGALAGYVAGSSSASVVVSALLNTLTNQTVGRELRMIQLFVTTLDGITRIEHSYVVEAEALLAIGTNSFQSYGSALMTGYELPNVEGWDMATRGNRINALVAAWRNIGKLNLRDITLFGMDHITFSHLAPYISITMMTALEFSLLSADMRDALSRAQIIEADFLLGGDEVGDIRRSGIMSSTVGESSQFFRPGKPLEQAVCKRAMRELSRYILQLKRTLVRG